LNPIARITHQPIRASQIVKIPPAKLPTAKTQPRVEGRVSKNVRAARIMLAATRQIPSFILCAFPRAPILHSKAMFYYGITYLNESLYICYYSFKEPLWNGIGQSQNRYNPKNNLQLSVNHLPRFRLAFREGRSFSAPLPLLCRPRPRFPAEVLPR